LNDSASVTSRALKLGSRQLGASLRSPASHRAHLLHSKPTAVRCRDDKKPEVLRSNFAGPGRTRCIELCLALSEVTETLPQTISDTTLSFHAIILDHAVFGHIPMRLDESVLSTAAKSNGAHRLPISPPRDAAMLSSWSALYILQTSQLETSTHHHICQMTAGRECLPEVLASPSLC